MALLDAHGDSAGDDQAAAHHSRSRSRQHMMNTYSSLQQGVPSTRTLTEQPQEQQMQSTRQQQQPSSRAADGLQEVQHELQQAVHATHDYILHHHRGITTFLVAITRVLQQTDATLLPAVYFYIGCTFGATPAKLGMMSFSSLLVSAFAAPIGGVLGHYFNRARLVACACAYWACCTALFAAASSSNQALLLWACNGIGLGVMIPNAQSLVADYYDERHRGRAFGMLLAVGNLGSMLSSAYATNIGGASIFGLAGWRFAFLSVSAVSAMAGAAMWLAGKDPRCSSSTWQLDAAFRCPGSSSSSSSGDRGAGSCSSSNRHDPSSDLWNVDRRKNKKANNVSFVDFSSSSSTAADGDMKSGRDQQMESSSTASFAAADTVSNNVINSREAATDDQLSHSRLISSDTTSSSSLGPVARGSRRGAAMSVSAVRDAAKAFMASTLVREVWVVLTTPSFIVVVVQGFLGSMPWAAFSFTTLYLQLQGWSDAAASTLLAMFSASDAAGALLGGVVGDWAAARYPNHGRITACQFSVGIGVPLCLLIFQGLPLGLPSGAAGFGVLLLYGSLFCGTGLLISWAATACNNPIFAEIVPPHLRTLVYAFDRCLETALSAAGAPLVGLVAQQQGFKGAATTGDCSTGTRFTHHQPDLAKARALGNALTLFSTVPWTLCALVYSFLHCTYPRDKMRSCAARGAPGEPVAFTPLPAQQEAEETQPGRVGGGAEAPVGLLDRVDAYISNAGGELQLQQRGERAGCHLGDEEEGVELVQQAEHR